MRFIPLPGLLDAACLARVLEMIAAAPFVDGRGTAGKMLAAIKNNEQIDRKNHAARSDLDDTLVKALFENPRVMTTVYPMRIVPPMIARYRQGMAYGSHCDNPLMGPLSSALRTDLSCTIFLADPATYDGGVLEIETGNGAVPFKMNAGDAILYPSGAIHRVTEVTRGERLVAVTWLQSRVADTQQREVLADLDRACAMLRKREGQSPETLLAQQVHGTLLRMWAQG